MSEIDGKIARANGRLSASKVGVSIQRIGDRLALRATLPPKPSSKLKIAHQQRLFTHHHANAEGVKLAERLARKIRTLLDYGDFCWEHYLRKIAAEDRPSVADWIAKFEAYYFSRRARNPKSETTWVKDYLFVFRKLPAGEELTPKLLTAAVLETLPDSRSRRRWCMALGALAKFANIEIDLKPFSGSYSSKKVMPRDLPDDRTILEWFYKLIDSQWQWTYGMLATYGLRPHEIFHLNLDHMPIVQVLDGKTGARRIWPCFPEWVEEFDLAIAKVPTVNGKNNSRLGESCARFFKLAGIPFKPYDLRHAWAIRTLEFGLDISLAAQQMGHSAQVHSECYHQWITDRHHQRAYEALMMRSDRPKAPTMSELS